MAKNKNKKNIHITLKVCNLSRIFEESGVLRSLGGIDAKRGLVCKTVLGSPVFTRAGKGPLVLGWVLGSAGPVGCLFSGSSVIGFLPSRGEWAGFVCEPRKGSCSIEYVDAVSLSRLRGRWCVGS